MQAATLVACGLQSRDLKEKRDDEEGMVLWGSRGVGGWMGWDRWMNGWKDGWMDGRVILRCLYLCYIATEPTSFDDFIYDMCSCMNE